MSSDNDMYCSRCDVHGHERGKEECLHYWKTTEVPFRERMQKMVGKVFKTADPGPHLFDENNERYSTPPGTLVRLTHYTPETKRLKAGNYWSVETLDGNYSAAQIYQDDLEELNALDRLSLIKRDD